MELGQLLKNARMEAGLTQRQLCGDTITRNMLSQIENGSARPSMDTLRILASRLGKPMSYFLQEPAASREQTVLLDAKAAWQAGDADTCLKQLTTLAPGDPLCDDEAALLSALCRLQLARQALAENRVLYARTLLAEPLSGTYATLLHRPRLLLLGETAPEEAANIVPLLPDLDEELLLRAQAEADPQKRAILLDAAADRTAPRWCLLRGDAAAALGQYREAISFYLPAEAQAYARLERCYEQLEDYKMAYYYACKQR